MIDALSKYRSSLFLGTITLMSWFCIANSHRCSADEPMLSPEREVESTPATSALASRGEELFRTIVKPALSQTCFKCHGPDEETREADLRLDVRDSAVEDLGGYFPIKPGDLEASEVWQRIVSDDEDLKMPPPDSGLQLTPEQQEAIRTWIELDAPYPQHWSFAPIQDVVTPLVSPTQWTANSIDAFVEKGWEAAGLSASPAADRRVLIRRLSLDLLGLLPNSSEVEAYVNDPRPDATQRLVDRLLASPRFGERWGRHWLDQARYADTNGYTVDGERSIWPYRDWVIHAINADMPFDQFTIEQLAGDLLPDPTMSQLIATGFHRNTLVNQEGGSDREQFRNESIVDRVNTTGTVWLGLTVGCSQCHSHKYDPLQHSEYYELFAFFNQSTDANSIAPTLRVIDEADETRLNQLERQWKVAQKSLSDYDRELKAQAKADSQSTGEEDKEAVDPWKPAEVNSVEAESEVDFEELADGSWLARGENRASDSYRITLANPKSRPTAFRIEALTHESLPKMGPGRAGNGNFVLNEVTLLDDQGEAIPWLVAHSDHSQQGYPVEAAIDGDPTTGWAINVKQGSLNVDRAAVLAPDWSKVDREVDSLVLLLLFADQPPHYNIGRFRISATTTDLKTLDLPDPVRQQLVKEESAAKKRFESFRNQFPTTMVMSDQSDARETHVHIRGDFLRHGEVVKPQTPSFLPPLHTGESMANRLDLAQWLVTKQNPLTARVGANRIWMRFFGQGIVETENDFGSQGSLPTHPLLLDWLASRWQEQDWSTKSLIRTIVSSSAYQQSSVIDPERWAKDPLNKKLARQVRIRVEAEIVRDTALQVSGLLTNRIGGKSVYPPQPDGVYNFTQRRAAWPTSQGADRYRRGMYTFFMRSAPHPLFTTFDTPRFNTTCTRRVRSNTPLQSLTQANDPAMVEMARAFALRLVRQDPATIEQGIQQAFDDAFSRKPTERESDVLINYWEEMRQAYEDDRENKMAWLADSMTSGTDYPQADLAAWIAVCRVMINLDEFITRE